jgi:hypothetical protein
MVSLEQILRSLLKVGLEAAVPIIGTVAAAAIEESSGLLLDHRTEARARDLHARLLRSLEDRAKTLDGLTPGRLDYLLPTIELILDRHGIRPNEWSQIHFSVGRATTAVLNRASNDAKGLSDDDVEVIRSLVNAFHAALLTGRETLQRTEADFRSLVLENLDDLAGKIVHLTALQAEAIADLAAAALVGLPQRPWRPGISPPGALLRADIEGAVSFHGRRSEIESIETWCIGTAQIGVRLYTGAGGLGKTRLFIEMCQRLQARRWRAGFLDDRATRAPAATWRNLVNHPDSLFLVVDYAETRRAELIALLREAFATDNDCRIRIVLLARAAGDWWDQLKAERKGVDDLLTGPATQWFSLGPLTLTTEDRCQSFRMALNTFTDRLKPERPPSDDTPEDLDSKLFERVLLLHMSALAAIYGVPVKGEQGILDYILQRERRFWSELAEAKRLSSLVVPGIAQAMAVLTLGGGTRTRGEAVAVLEQIPLLKGQDAAVLNGISVLLHETYPGAKWIEPILPDLLGEHLVQVEVEKDPDALFDLVFGAREGGTDASPGL